MAVYASFVTGTLEHVTMLNSEQLDSFCSVSLAISSDCYAFESMYSTYFTQYLHVCVKYVV